MKIGIQLGALNPRMWSAATEAADRLGFDSVWIPEHLVVPIASDGSPIRGEDHPPIPSATPMFDALAYLAFLAGRTTNIRLGTNVYNIGTRHPFVTARAAATVDIVSNGRLDFGIGASWLRAEWDALGLDFDRRGARVDEAIDVCRRLWTEEIIEHHGTFFDFGPLAFEPKPVQHPGVPLHIGGDGPAAIRRAATVGAGWMPMNHRLEDLGASIAQLNALSERYERSTPIEVTISGDVTRTEDIQRYADAGVTRLIVRPWTRSSDALDGLQRFADEVLRPLQEQQ